VAVVGEAEAGHRSWPVTGVQTWALPISVQRPYPDRGALLPAPPQQSYIRRALLEPEPPPVASGGIRARTRARLFGSAFNTALTLDRKSVVEGKGGGVGARGRWETRSARG